ncbi:PAS domain S-box protein [Nostoc sp. UHCC 0870]|uniref:PAS domain S-box protein n=1 Tax=Nostoc sp. UHCC 0870 TaxID=2914041 RepID=UPI001EE10CF9|nr:PAS domain S-box protein [Nostoc sp. UHCC 0870]UKO99335.1 PAS domain S-box protein [Nostoc sp. UHCC 0870]
MFNAISDAIFVKNRQHRLILVNDAYCQLMGYSREELIGKTYDNFLPEIEADILRKNDELIFTQHINSEQEEKLTDAYGMTHWVVTKKCLFQDKANNKFLVGTIHNITKYKQISDELHASKQLLQAVMDGIPQGIFWKNRDSVYSGCNQKFAEVVGISSPSEIINKSDYELPWITEEADSFQRCVRLACAKDLQSLMYSHTAESEIVECQQPVDGRPLWLETNKIPLKDTEGNVVGILGTVQDITIRKQAEVALTEKASLAAFRVEINHAITQSYNLQTTLKCCTDAMVQHLNAAFARIWTLNELENVLELQASSGMYTHIDGAHGRVPVGMFKIGLIAQERQPHLTNEVLTDPRVGDKAWAKQQGMVAFAGYPLILDGNLIGVMAMFSRQALPESVLDALNLAANEVALGIKRIQTKQALQASESKYRNLVETSQDVIWSIDAQGYWTFVNPAVKNIYGYEPEEMIGRHYSEFAPSEKLHNDLDIFPRLLAGESLSQYETVVLAKDGSTLNLLCNAIAIKDENGSIIGITGTATNITEIKQAEAAMQRTNAVLKAQQEASIDSILVIDENRNIASYNQCFRQLWQIPGELMNTGCDRQILGWVLNQLENPEEFLAKVEYLYEHPEERSHNEIKLKSGKIFERYSAPVYSSAGDYYGRIWYFRDITERNQAEVALRDSEAQLRQQARQLKQALQELQHTQTQLIQSEKMSSLGQLVAGVAHEINNPVNFIYGNLNCINDYTQELLLLLQLYQKNYPSPVKEIEDFTDFIELEFLISDLPRMLKSVKHGAERIRDIVLSLRTFSRLDEAEMKAVNIHDGIDSTLMILQSRLKENHQHPKIQIIKEYGEFPLVECYAGQLNQVFMNILANAIDALEESSIKNTAQLAIDDEILNQPQIHIRTQLIESNQVKISITDNGLGIPEAFKQQIFDPFFTTKDIGKGTGLGLAISYQIITVKHGGSLECCSTPGEGSEFVITIPLNQHK